MNTDSLRQLTEELRSGSVGLMLDTNALRTSNALFDLAEMIQALNDHRPEQQRIQLFVSQLVCAERLYQLKRQHAARYDRDVFLQQLGSKGIVREAFDAPHAAHFADLMHTLFQTDEEWQHFKLEWYIQKLGMADKCQVRAKGRRCSSTVDWLIMVQAGTGNRWLITEDSGAEFRGFDRKVSLADAKKAVMALMTSLPVPVLH